MDESIIREYYQIIRNKISQGRFDSAISSIEKLLCNFPSNENGYYYRGICEFALEKYEDAKKYFKATIQFNPGYGKAYFNLGVCFFEENKFDLALINIAKALVIFTRSKELDKKHRCIEALKTIQKERDL